MSDRYGRIGNDDDSSGSLSYDPTKPYAAFNVKKLDEALQGRGDKKKFRRVQEGFLIGGALGYDTFDKIVKWTKKQKTPLERGAALVVASPAILGAHIVGAGGSLTGAVIGAAASITEVPAVHVAHRIGDFISKRTQRAGGALPHIIGESHDARETVNLIRSTERLTPSPQQRQQQQR